MRGTTIALLLMGAGPLCAEPPDQAAALEHVRRLEKQRIELANHLAQSVCAVFRGQGGGSGVIITEDGLLLSNFHVTELANEMRIGLNDQRIHPAVVLGVDPSGDLSLLRLTEKRKWSATPLGDSDALRQGDWVYAMGNPFLLATDFTPTITLGVVSGINRYQPGSIRGTLLYPDCIQTDASINPGNSGGPLFNFQGEVVGINGRVSLRERGRVNIGVGYAISSNQIKLCLPELRAGLVMEHGTLNATVRSIDDPDWPGGIRVTFDQMLDPGAAFDAGIEVGDALLEFQGEKITGVNQFSRLIAVLPKGRRVHLKIARYENEKWNDKEFKLRLDGVPLIKKSQLRTKQVPQKYIDMEIDRTFDAARAAVQAIGDEKRSGKLTVRGREPRTLTEKYGTAAIVLGLGGDKPPPEHDEADAFIRIKLGERERFVTPTGGLDKGQPLDEDVRKDMLERVAAWNDVLQPGAREKFDSVAFTGGAIVGGTTCDVMEVKTKAGLERVYYIHLQTGRILRVDIYSNTWVRWISLYFTKWQNAGGLNRPYTVAIWDRDKDKLLQTLDYDWIKKA